MISTAVSLLTIALSPSPFEVVVSCPFSHKLLNPVLEPATLYLSHRDLNLVEFSVQHLLAVRTDLFHLIRLVDFSQVREALGVVLANITGHDYLQSMRVSPTPLR